MTRLIKSYLRRGKRRVQAGQLSTAERKAHQERALAAAHGGEGGSRRKLELAS